MNSKIKIIKEKVAEKYGFIYWDNIIRDFKLNRVTEFELSKFYDEVIFEVATDFKAYSIEDITSTVEVAFINYCNSLK